MNYFLRANKIIDIRKELATLNGNSCWSFCITYLQPNRNVEFRESKQSNGKTDYTNNNLGLRLVLSELRTSR